MCSHSSVAGPSRTLEGLTLAAPCLPGGGARALLLVWLLLGSLLPAAAWAQGAPATTAPEGAAPAGVDTLYARGVAALQKKDAEAAEAALRACVTQAPARVDCRWELGWALSLQRRWAEVVEAWEAVEALQPDHPELAEHLGRARAQAALAAELEQEAAEAPEPPDPKALEGRRLRLRAAGDVMLGSDFPKGYLPPGGGGAVLAGVRDLLADADLTFINLEGPLCDGGETRKCGKGGNCYAFRSPTAYGAHLREAGVDLASTANNHSGDFGEYCRRETEATLDALEIAWSGPPGSVATVEAQGLRVAMIAFHTSSACNWVNDHAAAAALVRKAGRSHDLVVVSFHGGAEGSKALRVPHGRETFYGENRGHLRAFTHAVVDAGADLVLGHGPHVVRGIEVYKGRLIAYSLGNFATYGRFNLSGPLGLGLVLEVELAGDGRFLGGQLLATRQIGKGFAVRDEGGGAIKLIRRLSKQDFPETGVVVGKEGRIWAPASAPSP